MLCPCECSEHFLLQTNTCVVQHAFIRDLDVMDNRPVLALLSEANAEVTEEIMDIVEDPGSGNIYVRASTECWVPACVIKSLNVCPVVS